MNNEDLQNELPVQQRLKALRLRSGDTIRKAMSYADMKSTSAWCHYESDDYDKNYIPADIVVSILPHWIGKGDPSITTDDLLDLMNPRTLHALHAIKTAQVPSTLSTERTTTFSVKTDDNVAMKRIIKSVYEAL